MSPAAVGIRSPITTKPCSLQNSDPNLNFSPFSPNGVPDNDRQSTQAPIFGDANVFDSRSMHGGSTCQRTESSELGRSRPRLVKVRKQLHGRSRAVSGYVGSGFNPFRSVSENSDRVNDCSSTSNGFLEKCVPNEVGYSGLGFVFGANGSNFASNLSSTVHSGGRQFGANVEEVCSRVESLKSENLGFVFGSTQGKSSEYDRTSVSKAEYEKVDGMDSLFGANGDDLEVKLEFEKGELNECGVDSWSGNLGKANLATEVGCGKDTKVDLNFELGDSCESMAETGVNFGSNFNFEVGNSSASMAEPDGENVGFVFGTTQNHSSRAGASGLGFVFGASWSNSVSNFNFEKGGSDENLRNAVPDDPRKVNVKSERESHNVEGTEVKFDFKETMIWKEDYFKGVFVFGSSGSKNCRFKDCVTSNCPYEVKWSNETPKICSIIAGARDGNLDSSLNDKCKPISFDNGSDVASGSILNPEFNLPDEIKKLNIDDFKNVDGADNKKSFANADVSVVTRSGRKDSTSSNGNSDSTHEGSLALGAAATGNDGDKFESGKVCNIASASVCISHSESFTVQAPLGSISFDGRLSAGHVNDGAPLNVAVPSSLSSTGLDSQANVGVSEASTMARVGDKHDESSSTINPDQLGVAFADFQGPIWDPSCFKASLFSESNKKLEFNARSRSNKGKKSKTMREKLKQPCSCEQWLERNHVQNESSAKETLNSSGCYSPVDFSPYEETVVIEQLQRENFVTSNDSAYIHNHHLVASVMDSTVDSGLKVGERLDVVNDDKKKSSEPKQESSGCHSERCYLGDCSVKGSIFGAKTTFRGFNYDHLCSSSSSGVASGQGANGFNAESNPQIHFCFASGLKGMGGKKFCFSASSAAQTSPSATKRLHRRKNSRKGPQPFNTVPNHNDQGDLSASPNKEGDKSEESEQGKRSSTSSTVSIQEECETWRLRGNQAYKNGYLSKAEEFYTCGINSVSSCETSVCCLRPLVICYSNRAATRMSLGNMREAIRDCEMAATLDPNFQKVQIRAANCHLFLGEVENALHYFNRCLQSGAAICLDRRITIEAADGLRNAQKVAESTNRSTKLLVEGTSDAVLSALDVIAEALSISPYSERLLELKAEFMFMLRKYEEVIKLCEQTLDAAEKNFASLGTDNQLVDIGGSQSGSYSFSRLWRWRLMSKSYFYLGRLEAALDLLKKLEQMGPVTDKDACKLLESSIVLAATIRDLLRHKGTGNEAVRSGRYAEAVEHYTAALSSNLESRPFAAICFCNRAVAHQALGQIADAIADCSLAIALDGNYSKSVSRRATLHEMIRDYGQAAVDLQRLLSILKIQSDEIARDYGSPGRFTGGTKELRQGHQRLALMEEQAKKKVSLDFYLILGVRESDTASDVKKAYHKAALRHHPDKVGQFLARSESGDEGRLWMEIVQEVHMDADRLFKMIGEAYAVLSDPAKRLQYDLDEKIRKASKEDNGSSPHRRTSDAHSGRSQSYRRNWKDNWKTYGYSHS